MSTRSKEYQALELLGPWTNDREWEQRVLLAHAIADKVISGRGRQEIPIEGGAVLPAFVRGLEAEIRQELPVNCGIDVGVTIDVESGLMSVEICAHGRSAYEQAKASGTDYVRCRACASDTADTCQPLNGPVDMVCPCGKLREPYDCQSDEWMKA